MDNRSMELIRQKFLRKLKGLLPEFSEFSERLSEDSHDYQELKNYRISVHQIAGTAKTFGFAQTSELASAVEECIDILLGEGKALPAGQDVVETARVRMNKLHEHSTKLLSSELKEEDGLDPEISPRHEKKSEEYKYKVLVGDDDALVIEIIEQNLNTNGCKVIGVPEGEEVAKRVLVEQPDLVIQDVNMPKISGFEILGQIKMNASTRDIPVLMLTKRAEDRNIVEGISAGAIDYIVKPFDVDDLVKRVLDNLSRRDITIMVADDDNVSREYLSMKFKRMGYRVVEANNGVEALNMINDSRADIILLDIMMPGVDGMAVLNHIKSSRKLDVPVIMITAKKQKEMILDSFKGGAHDFIVKPFDADLLLARVTAVLDRVQKRKVAA